MEQSNNAAKKNLVTWKGGNTHKSGDWLCGLNKTFSQNSLSEMRTHVPLSQDNMSLYCTKEAI